MVNLRSTFVFARLGFIFRAQVSVFGRRLRSETVTPVEAGLINNLDWTVRMYSRNSTLHHVTERTRLIHGLGSVHKMAINSLKWINSFENTLWIRPLTIERITPKHRKSLSPAPLIKGYVIQEMCYRHGTLSLYVSFTKKIKPTDLLLESEISYYSGTSYIETSFSNLKLSKLWSWSSSSSSSSSCYSSSSSSSRHPLTSEHRNSNPLSLFPFFPLVTVVKMVEKAQL